MRDTKLWIGLGLVAVLSFSVLGYYGREIYHQSPPIPERVIASDSTIIFSKQDILDGQNVWQAFGGQEVGSIWGHGAYVAPDWSADWLHREAMWLLDRWATDKYGKPYSQLEEDAQAALQVTLQRELRTNTYDAATGELRVSALRAAAIAAVSRHYTALFGDAPEAESLRNAYALPANMVTDPQRRQALNAFFSGRRGRA